jgi:hypothetical protein
MQQSSGQLPYQLITVSTGYVLQPDFTKQVIGAASPVVTVQQPVRLRALHHKML